MTLNQLFLVLVSLMFSACVLFDESASKKPAATGLIATPPSYYSTAKAKYLGSKYKDNLDRLVERIGRNSKTSTLQFANNISSVGGIGFFTHSATKSPDERYLEVVVSTPETFETKGDVSEKVQQLFSRYGAELLGILSSDGDIYRDKELSGYGLNLAWRNVITQPSGSRVTMARAIIYLPKERALNFIHNDIKQSDLLTDAVIFAVDEDGPLNLVSYKPEPLRPEIRPAIQEDDLTNAPVAATQGRSSPAGSVKTAAQKADPNFEIAKKDAAAIIGKATPQETKAETKKVIASAQKTPAKSAAPVDASLKDAPKLSSPIAPNPVEQVALAKQSESVPLIPTMEPQVEPQSIAEETAVVAPSNAVETTTRDLAVPASTVERGASTDKAQEKVDAPALAAAPKPVAPAQSPEMRRAPTAETVITPPREIAPAVAETLKSQSAAQERPVAQPTEKRLTVEPPKVEQKVATAPTIVAKNERLPVTALRPAEVAPVTPAETISPAPTNEVTDKAVPIVKAAEPARLAKPTVVTSVTTPAEKQLLRSPSSSAPAKAMVEEKIGDLPAPELVAPRAPLPAAPIQALTPEPTKPAPVPARVETQSVEVKPAAPIGTVEPKKLVTERPVKEQVALVNKPSEAIPEKTPAAKGPAQTPGPERAKSATTPMAAKADVQSIEAKPSPPAAAIRPVETVVEKPVNEQIALLTKPTEPTVERKPVGPAMQKALEGFIIQLAFNDKNKARQWAESMERRGYAVSVTEAGTEGALRVRLGNFTVRDEAERQLRSFKQDGLSGIVINLPQAFRPDARSTVP